MPIPFQDVIDLECTNLTTVNMVIKVNRVNYIQSALDSQSSGHMLPWVVKDDTTGEVTF